MRNIAAWGFTIALTMYSIIHYFTYFYPLESLFNLLSMLGLCTVIFSFTYLHTRKLILPLFFFITSVVIQMITNQTLFYRAILDGLLQMRSLIVLLMIVPMISYVFREEPYIEEIMSTARNSLNTSRKFYFGLMSMTQVIAFFLLYGCIPMMYQFVNGFLGNKKGESWDKFKGTAILRAFALCMLWVVTVPSFLFAMESLRASLWIVTLQGFFISLCGICIAVSFSYFQQKHEGIDITAEIQKEIEKVVTHSKNDGEISREVWEFILLFFSLFGTIFALHGILDWELLIILPPVVLIWTMLYFLLKGKLPRFFQHSKQYFTRDLVGKSQEFTLLLAAGVLIYTLNESGIGEWMVDYIFQLADSLNLNFLWILPFIVLVMGLLGLGPLMVMVLAGGILQNVSLPFPPELVVLSLTTGSVLTVLISPFVLPVIVMSGSNGLSVIKNGFKFNYLYAAALYLFVQIYIQLVLFFIFS